MTCQNEEASECKEELMDVDIADASNGCITEIKENGLLLWPVLPQEHGEGLPYAPVNWPSPGDIWGWRVGRRIAASGFYLDRYLYLPMRFQKSRCKRDSFASKLSAEQYVRARFAGTDVNAFFSSFSWKIPSKQAYLSKGDPPNQSPQNEYCFSPNERGSIHISSEEMAEQSSLDSPSGLGVCKAGNRFCSIVLGEEISPFAAAQACDVCCSESGFCRECCCILCCNTIDLSLGGYSYFRCEATTHDDLICGHAAHIDCALRSYMAGTVGGSAGLDTDYYCRRCDTRTDLTKHVTKLFKTCEAIESRVDIEKMLNVGSCLLRGSLKEGSQRLLSHIESALQKLKGGSNLEDVWKVEIDVVTVPTGGQLDYVNYAPADIGEDNLSLQSEYLKLEEEIDHVLQELRKSQELEYRIARETLCAKKDNLISLFQQVDKEKSELIQHTPSTNRDALLSSIVVKEEHIQCELSKLKDMEKVAKGVGKTPKHILKEQFGLDVEG